MDNLLYNIQIKPSQVHGKGVFATQFLLKGTELICDVLLSNINNLHDDFYNYKYPWSRKFDSVCIGFGSYLNHSEKPNVRIYKINKINLTKTFITLRDINPNEELFIKYGINKTFK